MGVFSFPKTERLLNRADFVNLNRSGRRHHSEHFVVISKQNGLGITRFGVSVSKKTGNAVKRNRVKRLLREFFRLRRSHFPNGHDIVIVAKKTSNSLDFWQVEEELGEIIANKKFPL